ncbi:MAG: 4a-hydroxytetrahydrobiopterin dehydratase [Polyangiaceae bacterium]|nr:4a-hydroxytetrahydrobiopterin dehydratase [Polyangiaceae bacterium]
MTSLLSAAERAAWLPELGDSGWRAVAGRDALRKVWRFRSFSEAWGFMSRVALEAARADHHPEWSNAYDIVDVTLTTHHAGGLTRLDVELARRIDRVAGAAEVERDLTRRIQCACSPSSAEDRQTR